MSTFVIALLLLIVGPIVAVLCYGVFLYNSLVRLRNHVENAWSQIDVQLKRRYDLIPNLVSTVKGYMEHEQTVLENVTRARAQAMQATGVQERAGAENQLTRAIGGVRAVIEQYPDLKASQNVMALQEELASTENKIAFARQFYNDSVMRLNTKVEQFPSNIVASMGGFRRSEFFEIEDPTERQPVAVDFSNTP
jgi:LemA protein